MIGSSRYVDCRCFFIDPVEISCDQLISGSSRGNYLSLYDAAPLQKFGNYLRSMKKSADRGADQLIDQLIAFGRNP